MFGDLSSCSIMTACHERTARPFMKTRFDLLGGCCMITGEAFAKSMMPSERVGPGSTN